MRHAPSADAASAATAAAAAADSDNSSATTRDHDRPITPAGVAAAKACARALLAAGWLPDLVVASDALRSRQTLDAMGEEVPALKKVRVRFAGSLYAAAAMDDNQTARALAATLEEALSCSSGSEDEASTAAAASSSSSSSEEERREDTGKGASSSCSGCSPTTVLAVGHNKVRFLLPLHCFRDWVLSLLSFRR